MTTGEGGQHRAAHRLGDLLHTAEIAVGGRRKAGFDDVHAEGIELPGQAQLLLRSHGVARGLLAIPQSGIENEYVLQHVGSPSSV